MENIIYINNINSIFKNNIFNNKINMDPTKEIISSLKFIGKLQRGDKINTKFMYRQPDGILTRLSRTFINHDNRNNALLFVQRVISSSFEIINNYSKSDKESDKILCINIINDLKQARNGLDHLKDTYSEDLKFKCDMETLLQEIDAKFNDLHYVTNNFTNIELNNDSTNQFTTDSNIE